MDFKLYRNAVSTMFTQNRLLKFALVVMLIMLVWLSYSLVKAVNNQTVVIIPKGLDKTVTMQGGEFDQQYLIAMGNYIAGLYWSFTPSQVQGQYQQLASLLAPAVSPALKADLIAMADAHKANEVTMSFIINDIQVELQPQRIITVKGWQSKYILKNRVSEGAFILEIAYGTQAGRLQVLSIKEKTP
jgi:type IV conjugative transfer system protein TraE